MARFPVFSFPFGDHLIQVLDWMRPPASGGGPTQSCFPSLRSLSFLPPTKVYASVIHLNIYTLLQLPLSACRIRRLKPKTPASPCASSKGGPVAYHFTSGRYTARPSCESASLPGLFCMMGFPREGDFAHAFLMGFWPLLRHDGIYQSGLRESFVHLPSMAGRGWVVMSSTNPERCGSMFPKPFFSGFPH
ncbi:unnamed protein product [Ectocarpus sp. 4 AP-2014]